MPPQVEEVENKGEESGIAYITRHDGIYRSFQRAISEGKPVNTTLYLGALSRLPNQSESDFTIRFVKKYWKEYTEKNAERVSMLREDARHSLLLVDGELKKFNADMAFEHATNKAQIFNLIHPMTRTEVSAYCKAKGIKMSQNDKREQQTARLSMTPNKRTAVESLEYPQSKKIKVDATASDT
ncbi:hypothetical protein F4861DRAFT_534973 [Xylaria intraflava]|nr:hypothetical protein F4861DRAFT_534973 [Xylaria intraflava]